MFYFDKNVYERPIALHKLKSINKFFSFLYKNNYFCKLVIGNYDVLNYTILVTILSRMQLNFTCYSLWIFIIILEKSLLF